MEFVDRLLDFKERNKINGEKLYQGCNKLLEQIYKEYDFVQSNKLETHDQFYPLYKESSRGLLFGLEFELIHKANSSVPKPKKKIVIESEHVKRLYPTLYEFVKNNFLRRIVGSEKYLEWCKFNKEYGDFINLLISEFKTKDNWITQLYSWYWSNQLTKSFEPKVSDFSLLFGEVLLHQQLKIAEQSEKPLVFEPVNLYLLLANSPAHIFVNTPESALNSIYLFENYKVNCYTNKFMLKCYELSNTNYTISLVPNTRWPSGYRPQYEMTIEDKAIGLQIDWISKFGHHLRMETDTIYTGICDFITENSSQYGWEISK